MKNAVPNSHDSATSKFESEQLVEYVFVLSRPMSKLVPNTLKKSRAKIYVSMYSFGTYMSTKIFKQ